MKTFNPFDQYELEEWFLQMYKFAEWSMKYNVIDMVGKTAVHKEKTYQQRSLSDITMAVIHHSDTTQGSAESFARYQVSKGFPGIGYYSVVLPDGTRQITNSLTTKSWHAGSLLVQGDENLYGVGICNVGKFTFDRHPTDEQYESTAVEILNIQRILRRELKIVGHGYFKDTSCPGNFDIERLKKMINNNIK